MSAPEEGPRESTREGPREGPQEGEIEGRFRPGALAAVTAAGIVVAIAPIPGLAWPAHGALAVLTVAAGFWITEAIPLAVTALLIPVMAVALRVAEPKVAFSGFGDPILFLFLGTFLITNATFEHGLNHRLARSVLHSRLIQSDPSRMVWAVAILGCGISAWVNNTATTAILLPLAMAAQGRVPPRLLTGILLLAAYAPSLGGLATPVGTAPNLIGLRLLEEGAGERITFARWCATFAPLAILATLMVAAWFRFVVGRGSGEGGNRRTAATGTEPPPEAPRAGDGGIHGPPRPWSLAERALIPVIIGVIALWIVPGILLATPLRDRPWLQGWNAGLPETSVPLLGGAVLFLLPSGRGKERILDIGVLRRIDWSTLMLFGGGLSLGTLLFQTGLARAIGEWIFAAVPIHGEFGIILAATLMAVLVSETTSNTASASLVVPVVLALAQTAGVDPLKPALAATVGCSFGFMLPVSTPPNALVFATGRVRISEMVRYGVLLDLAGILLVSVWVWCVG